MNAKEFSIDRIISTNNTIEIDDCSEKNRDVFENRGLSPEWMKFEKNRMVKMDFGNWRRE